MSWGNWPTEKNGPIDPAQRIGRSERSLRKLTSMRTLITFVFLLTSLSCLSGQKMLLIERANRAKTTKLYVGAPLRFRLTGEENYWYRRTITGILPESNSLLLDNFLVNLDSIDAIKVNRKALWRITGGALLTFGASLTLATTVGKVIYHDDDVDAPKLLGIAAVSFGTGWFLSTPRKLKLGKRHRLRIVEVKFPDPLIPPPPSKQ